MQFKVYGRLRSMVLFRLGLVTASTKDPGWATCPKPYIEILLSALKPRLTFTPK